MAYSVVSLKYQTAGFRSYDIMACHIILATGQHNFASNHPLCRALDKGASTTNLKLWFDSARYRTRNLPDTGNALPRGYLS